MPPARIAAVTVLGLRIAYGAALIAAPTRLARRWLGPGAASEAAQVALRGLGAREVVLHGAALRAALRDEPLGLWLGASIVGDLTDIAATLAGRERLPDESPVATAVVAGGSAAISAAVAVAAR